MLRVIFTILSVLANQYDIPTNWWNEIPKRNYYEVSTVFQPEEDRAATEEAVYYWEITRDPVKRIQPFIETTPSPFAHIYLLPMSMRWLVTNEEDNFIIGLAFPFTTGPCMIWYEEGLRKEYLATLLSHEIGHCLSLQHNFFFENSLMSALLTRIDPSVDTFTYQALRRINKAY